MPLEFWIPTIISVVSLVWNYRQSRQIVHLQHEAEKKGLIHKFQFEKEFQVYVSLWDKLIDLRDRTLALRMVDQNDSAASVMLAFQKTKEAFSEVVNVYQKNQPFYAEEVFKAVGQLVKYSWLEAYDASKKDPPDKELRDKNQAKIISIVDNVCAVIRRRIQV